MIILRFHSKIHVTNHHQCVVLIYLALVCGMGLITTLDAGAQDVDISGTAWVTDWPASREGKRNDESPALQFHRYNLLPFIDSLGVHYSFWGNSSGETVSMEFAVEWSEGDGGVLNGREVSLAEMPPGVVIESIDLLMDVIVNDQSVGEFYLPLDTMNLGPAPSMTFIDISDVEWDAVFVDVDSKTTQTIFESGFQLSAPRILHAVFAAVPENEYVVVDNQDPERAPEHIHRTVFIPDVDIWISWRDGRNRHWIPPGAVRRTKTGEPRDMGRSRLTGTRSTDRSRGRAATDAEEQRRDSGRTASTTEGGKVDVDELFGSKKGDDDDDEDRLYPAALAGAAAIGGLALLGGTVGYFGSAATAPIGLMSGYVERDWGILLNVSINAEVFGEKKGAENLIAGITGFYNLVNARIQPAIGIGARVTEEGSESLSTEPSFSLGLVGNFGQLVLMAGYDITTPDLRFGIGVNLRHRN